MNFILETERLRAREFILEDAPFIIELLNSPEWLRFIGDRNVKTEEQAAAYLENGPLKSYHEHGFGLYLVKRKEDEKKIGMCGIIRREHLRNPDIGFAFLPEFNGNGYALEIAASILSYANEKLHFPVIYAITLPDNLKSIRLLEKLGLQFKKTFCFPNSKEELLLYSTEKEN